MTVHVFDYTDWFMAATGHSPGDVDWDCDFSYVIVDLEADTVEEINSNSQFWEQKMRERFPDRIEHGDLSRHRGKLEGGTSLKAEYPKVWERLNRWCEWRS